MNRHCTNLPKRFCFCIFYHFFQLGSFSGKKAMVSLPTWLNKYWNQPTFNVQFSLSFSQIHFDHIFQVCKESYGFLKTNRGLCWATFFDCCRQSLKWLLHPSTHPSTHPGLDFFNAKNYIILSWPFYAITIYYHFHVVVEQLFLSRPLFAIKYIFHN